MEKYDIISIQKFSFCYLEIYLMAVNGIISIPEFLIAFSKSEFTSLIITGNIWIIFFVIYLILNIFLFFQIKQTESRISHLDSGMVIIQKIILSTVGTFISILIILECDEVANQTMGFLILIDCLFLSVTIIKSLCNRCFYEEKHSNKDSPCNILNQYFFMYFEVFCLTEIITSLCLNNIFYKCLNGAFLKIKSRYFFLLYAKK